MSEFEVSRRRFIGASAAAGGLATASGVAGAAVAQPGSPTGQVGVPPTSLAFTGRRVALPLVFGVMFLVLGGVTMRVDRTRRPEKI